MLKKKVKEMKAEITTLTTNDAKEKAHRAKEEENRRISQIHKSEIMFAEFKNALPEDSRLNVCIFTQSLSFHCIILIY